MNHNETLNFLRERGYGNAKTAIVLGSGLGNFADNLNTKKILPYKEIPHFPVSTAPGHKGNLILAEAGGKDVILMQGRFHFYEGYSREEIGYPIEIFGKLRIENLIVSNAAGGINRKLHTGDIMIIKDHINLLWDNPLIGKGTYPLTNKYYSEELINLAKSAAGELDINIQEGVFLSSPGPTYETKAEVRMMEFFGADSVSMSTVPEVLAASAFSMNVLGFSCITNHHFKDAAKDFSALGPDYLEKEVVEVANIIQAKLTKLLISILNKI